MRVSNMSSTIGFVLEADPTLVANIRFTIQTSRYEIRKKLQVSYSEDYNVSCAASSQWILTKPFV